MAHDQTLIQIRERSFLDIHDLALAVFRARPWAISLAAILGIAPFVALNYWLIGRQEMPPAAWFVLIFMEAPWATVPLTLVVGDLMFGQQPRPGSIFMRALRGLPTLILVHVILRGFLGMTVLLTPVIPATLWFSNEVILLERARWFKALRRCSRLSTDRGGEFAIQWIGQALFALLFAFCFAKGVGLATTILIEDQSAWELPYLNDVGGLRFQLGVWIAIGFFGLARFLIYIDQRIRSEGWELRLRLQAAGRAANEAAS